MVEGRGEVTCPACGHEIGPAERTGVTYMGALCEICLDKADGCAPEEDDNAIYADDDPR